MLSPIVERTAIAQVFASPAGLDSLIETVQMSGTTAPAEEGWREKLTLQRLRLQSLRDQARERYAGGAPGLQVAALICQMTDEVICELFETVLLAFPKATGANDELAARPPAARMEVGTLGVTEKVVPDVGATSP